MRKIFTHCRFSSVLVDGLLYRFKGDSMNTGGTRPNLSLFHDVLLYHLLSLLLILCV